MSIEYIESEIDNVRKNINNELCSNDTYGKDALYLLEDVLRLIELVIDEMKHD